MSLFSERGAASERVEQIARMLMENRIVNLGTNLQLVDGVYRVKASRERNGFKRVSEEQLL
jgi:hypothetical protein